MAEFLNPEKILKRVKLKEKMVAADFGCGAGSWTIPLAKILKKGKVFAIDLLDEPLSALIRKKRNEGLSNIEIRKADVEEGTPLLPESCDLVLMTNLLFECEEKKKVLEEGKRVLKKGGKILVVDWAKDNPLTKEIEWLSSEEVKKMAEELGLKLEDEFSTGVYHWGLLFSKPD